MGCGCGKSKPKYKKQIVPKRTKRICSSCKWPMSEFNSYNKTTKLKVAEWRCINKKCGKRQVRSQITRS